MTLEILYNEACPICRAEIAHYRRYCDAQGLDVRFEDLNTSDLTRWEVSADCAARRLYARDALGRVSGIDAFARLWQAMPRYRWMAWLVTRPGLRGVAAFCYDRALAPAIYRLHLRRLRRDAAKAVSS